MTGFLIVMLLLLAVAASGMGLAAYELDCRSDNDLLRDAKAQHYSDMMGWCGAFCLAICVAILFYLAFGG